MTKNISPGSIKGVNNILVKTRNNSKIMYVNKKVSPKINITNVFKLITYQTTNNKWFWNKKNSFNNSSFALLINFWFSFMYHLWNDVMLKLNYCMF